MLSQNRKEKTSSNSSELPVIPEKLYFTIGEVAQLCALKPHVLRYWEQEFSELSPSKRRGNRRYYQRREVLLIRRIRELLYGRGYTIEGARQQLQDKSNLAENSQQVTYGIISETIKRLQHVADELDA